MFATILSEVIIELKILEYYANDLHTHNCGVWPALLSLISPFSLAITVLSLVPFAQRGIHALVLLVTQRDLDISPICHYIVA